MSGPSDNPSTLDRQSLKQQKEAFVTGHTGTTPIECLFVCMASPVGIFLFFEIRQTILSLVHRRDNGTKDKMTVSWQVLAALESLTVLLPMTICQTDRLIPWGVTFLSVEFLIGLTLHGYNRRWRTIASTGSPRKDKRTSETSEFLPFLSYFRSTVLFTTFVAILAVDFHIFPRRFAKTETYGYGLMDLGAGSFVISAGFVSSYARRKMRSKRPGPKSGGDFVTVVKRTIPLVVIGCVRLIGNKGLEYQEHVSEYGVHWNFFFTLAVVGVFSHIIRRWVGGFMRQWCLPFGLLTIYQYLLSARGVQRFIEEAPRRCGMHQGWIFCDFFMANREGILGCVGYLVMYAISEEIASISIWNNASTIHPQKKPSLAHSSNTVAFQPPLHDNLRRRTKTLPNIQNNTSEQQIKAASHDVATHDSTESSHHTAKYLGTISIVLWLLHAFLTQTLEIATSRRSTNAPFVIWTLANNTTILFFIHTAYYFTPQARNDSSECPSLPVFTAVNRNGLVVFLIANLLTGAVNLTINTLAVSDGVALGVVFGYLCVVGLGALVLDKMLDWTVKL